MRKVSVIGSMNYDTTIHVANFPLHGETISSSGYSVSVGGKGVNQAAALAKAGLNVKMFGAVGKDTAGEEMINALDDLGVSVKHILRLDNVQTGQAFITVENSGNNNIMIISGANEHCSVQYAKDNEKKLCDADAVLAQMEIPAATVSGAFEMAKRQGVLTVLNPAPAQNFEQSLLDNVDIIIPNECEIETIYGKKIDTDKELEEACRWLEQAGVSIIIVTLGDRGCYLYCRGKGTFFNSYKVKAVDTTAAGDSFIGSFLSSYLEGNSMETAIDFAQKVAAITVSRKGAIQSIPTKEEVKGITLEK